VPIAGCGVAAELFFPAPDDCADDERRDLRRMEVTRFRDECFGDDVARAVFRRLRPGDADFRDRGAVAWAFFVMRSRVFFSCSFFAAASVSQASSWRLPSMPVHRA
jgi:hypothetical protein